MAFSWRGILLVLMNCCFLATVPLHGMQQEHKWDARSKEFLARKAHHEKWQWRGVYFVGAATVIGVGTLVAQGIMGCRDMNVLQGMCAQLRNVQEMTPKIMWGAFGAMCCVTLPHMRALGKEYWKNKNALTVAGTPQETIDVISDAAVIDIYIVLVWQYEHLPQDQPVEVGPLVVDSIFDLSLYAGSRISSKLENWRLARVARQQEAAERKRRQEATREAAQRNRIGNQMNALLGRAPLGALATLESLTLQMSDEYAVDREYFLNIITSRRDFLTGHP